MSRRFKVPLGLVPLSAHPASGLEGDTYYSSVDKTVYTYDGTNWTSIGGGDIDGGTPTTNYTGNTVINGGTP